MDQLIANIGLLATPVGSEAKKGQAQAEILLIEDAEIGVEDGIITYAGPRNAAHKAKETVDCEGNLVTPGLVDAHTHLVFGGWREKEMAFKLAGASYMDILKGGGGILNTVEHTRAATEAELEKKTSGLLAEMMRHGTTTVECKSGYGLSLADECKQLRVIRELQKKQPVDLAPTFLGAHTVPVEYKNDRESFIRLICDEMLPVVAGEKLAEYCDVFCETGVFSPEESIKILSRARELGLGLKAHVDEIDSTAAGAEMAARMGCVSAEHLIQASDEGITQMAAAGVIAVLLPGTSFYLDKPYARARKMLAEGLAVAIATDFNPGSCPNLNLQIPMALACLKYKLSPAEALTAVTLNAAAAIGREKTMGSLEPGKKANIVVWNAPNLEFIFYRFGSNLVNKVVIGGKQVC